MNESFVVGLVIGALIVVIAGQHRLLEILKDIRAELGKKGEISKQNKPKPGAGKIFRLLA